MKSVIEIDGSSGEGGGQILRTSLTLSLVTGKPFRIVGIRAGRKKPGLLNQHLTAAYAAAAISSAIIEGNEIGARELYFAPDRIRAGRYRFAVGSAGSCMLVLQTVLPALFAAKSESELILEGGTHNPFAPPFDFLEKTFLPLLRRMGLGIAARLLRPGFFPAGGGKIAVSIKPTGELSSIDLLDRGEIKSMRARAVVARLPRNIAERELRVTGETLGLEPEHMQIEETSGSRGPGNALIVEIECRNITEIITGFGMRGVSAEQVAERTAEDALEYLSSDAPVGKHLADQLLIPLALAGGGKFKTLPLTAHTLTNIDVIRRFLDIEIRVAKKEEKSSIIEVRAPRNQPWINGEGRDPEQ
jgi:RNA 3'-terminal phosphate cyclase (ATP)